MLEVQEVFLRGCLRTCGSRAGGKLGARLRRLAILSLHFEKLCLTCVFINYSCLLKPRKVRRASRFK